MKKNLVQFQMAVDKVEVREDQKVVIEGYASTPDIDSYNSIIVPDAIKGGLERYMKNPIVLLGHNPDKAIGIVENYTIDNTGFRVRAVISNDVDGIMKSIRDGVVKGFSIGFAALAFTYQTKGGTPLSALSETELEDLNYDDIVRRITDIELFEISVVTLPANPNALFSLTRAIKMFFQNHEKRAALDHLRQVDQGQEEVLSDIETSDEVETTEEVDQPETQGDEVETAGETPDTPQETDNDPQPAVETTVDEEPTAEVVEDPKAETESEEMRKVLELFDQAMGVIELQNGKIEKLEAIVSTIPAKRGFVTVNGNKPSEDPLLSEMRNAKQKALGNN